MTRIYEIFTAKSIRDQLNLVNIMFLIALATVFAVCFFSLLTSTVMRAYVGGESLWSKGRQKATLSLERYIIGGSPAEYEKFIEALKIPQGDNDALAEIESIDTDFGKVGKGLITGGNDPDEVLIMGIFLKYFKSWPYIRDAVDSWRDGVIQIQILENLSTEVLRTYEKKIMSPQVRDHFMSRLDDSSSKLINVEQMFSKNIANASKRIVQIAFAVMFMFTLLLGFLARYVSMRIHTQILADVNLISAGADEIAKGRYDSDIQASGSDELMQLAKSINLMGRKLTQAISDLKSKNELLHKANVVAVENVEKYNSLMRAISASAIVSETDYSGKIVSVNNKFCDISGYKKEELIGQNHRILKSRQHDQDFFKNLWSTISSGSLWTGEVCNRRKDGTIYWVLSTILPIQNGPKISGYFSIQFDISEAKLAQSQLVQASRLSALGELAGGVAHEINSPLAAAQLVVERLISLANLNKCANDVVIGSGEKILSALGRISKIVGSMRRLYRSPESTPFVSASLIQIVADVMGLSAEKFQNNGVEIRNAIDPDVNFECRPTEIAQVLVNLLNNSYRAIKDLPERWVEISGQSDGKTLKIAVTDSGHGINPELADKIMQPFVTTGQIGESLGVGLSISHRLVAEHGGKLYYDSTYPRTRFIIKIPLKHKSADQRSA